ncbi:hypothetical protein C4D60_Mb01t07930 [Musa balbisiana]|uniref:Uncharacterized protein n=1 Tax=Musa balbisiana TaxID=52838 RepID=A0A4V4H768_MUSBA|nr:hypothetical protein C4D60_Mb01t07930 [Musa balbisiana]
MSWVCRSSEDLQPWCIKEIISEEEKIKRKEKEKREKGGGGGAKVWIHMSNPVLRLRQWGLTGHCAATLASGGAEGLKQTQRERERWSRCCPRFAAFFMVGSDGSSKTLMERSHYICTRRTDRPFQTTPPSLESRKKGEECGERLALPSTTPSKPDGDAPRGGPLAASFLLPSVLSAAGQPIPPSLVSLVANRQILISVELHAAVDRLRKSGLLRSQGFVGGKRIDAYDGMTLQVQNPATGDVITSVPCMGKNELRANSLQVTGASGGGSERWDGEEAKVKGKWEEEEVVDGVEEVAMGEVEERGGYGWRGWRLVTSSPLHLPVPSPHHSPFLDPFPLILVPHSLTLFPYQHD